MYIKNVKIVFCNLVNKSKFGNYSLVYKLDDEGEGLMQTELLRGWEYKRSKDATFPAQWEAISGRRIHEEYGVQYTYSIQSLFRLDEKTDKKIDCRPALFSEYGKRLDDYGIKGGTIVTLSVAGTGTSFQGKYYVKPIVRGIYVDRAPINEVEEEAERRRKLAQVSPQELSELRLIAEKHGNAEMYQQLVDTNALSGLDREGYNQMVEILSEDVRSS